MRIHVIAVHYDNNKNIIGFRLLDSEASQNQTAVMDQPYNVVENILKSGKATIEGLEVSNNKIKGSNGSLDRYPALLNNNLIRKAMVIIATIDDVGYRVANYDGKTADEYANKIVAYSNNIQIANGKLVTKNGKQFISAISGNYINIPVAESSLNVSTNKSSNNNTGNNTNISNSNIAVNKNKYSYEKDDYNPRAIRVVTGNPIAKSRMKEYDEKCGMTLEQKMLKAMIGVQDSRPFYYSILALLKRVECDDSTCQTMAVSLDTLYFNPQFVKDLTVPEITFVLLHEVCHVAMKHLMRGDGLEHDAWNVATDLFINRHLALEFNMDEVGKPYPLNKKAYEHVSSENSFGSIQIPEKGLYSADVDVDKDTPEVMYQELTELARQMQQMQQQQQQQQSSNSGDDGHGNSSGQTPDGNNQSDNKQEQSQSGQGQNGQSQDSQDQNSQNQSGQSQSGQSQSGQDQSGQAQGQDGQDEQDGQSGQGQGQGSQNGGNGEQDNNSQQGNGNIEEKYNHSDEGNSLEKGNNGLHSGRQEDSASANQNGEDGDQGENKSSGLSNNTTYNKSEQRKPGRLVGKEYKGTTIGDQEADIVKDASTSGKSKEELAQSASTLLSQAVTMHRQRHSFGGDTPDFLERYVEEALAPKVNWRSVLRRFLTRASQKEYSFAHPDRRFLTRVNSDGSRQVFAGPHMAGEGELENVKIGIDTSGSISPRDIGIVLKQTYDMLKKYHGKAEVIYWDTRVRAVYNLDDPEKITELKPAGGGGTDPNCVFDYFDSNKDYKTHKKSKPSLIVMFTDGCFGDIDERYAKKYKNTVWVINGGYKFKPPFGVKAELRSEDI